MEVGTRVRFLTNGKIGVMKHPDDSKFIGTLGRDFTGIYEGPHDNPRLDGWHIISVVARAVEPGDEHCEAEMNKLGRDHRYYVPAYEGTFEPVSKVPQPPTSSLGDLLP